MAVKAMNFKLEEDRIADMKAVANAFHITMTDVVNAALDVYLAQKKQDPFYRLTLNVEEVSDNESKEILDALNSMSDDDLKISKVKKLEV